MADDVFADMSFDGKSAFSYYGLDLQYCVISAPVRKRSLLDIPCTDGRTDLLKNLGGPWYESRDLRAEFKARGDVRETVDKLISELEGQNVQIVLPLDTDHYMTGDIHISSAGYFPGADVVILATVGPWRYPASGSGEAVL